MLQSYCRLRNLCVPEEEYCYFPSFDLSLHRSSLQHGFQPVAQPSLPSSSASVLHSTSTSAKGNDGGGEGGGGSEDSSERKRRRASDDGEELPKGDEAAAGGGGGGGLPVSSVTIVGSTSSTPAPLTLVQPGLTQVLSAVRMAQTVVTNVVRPIASTPIPIASKPVEGAVTLSSLPQDKKATLLIGGGGPQQLPIATGGGYLSSSSSPGPVSVTPLGGSDMVTNLLLGGSFPTAMPMQILTPQAPLPVSQPQLHPTATTTSFTPPVGPKPLAQVQYILPTESSSIPQLTHQQILSLPGHAAVANGVHTGAGIRVSPGTRGETESNDWLTKKDS